MYTFFSGTILHVSLIGECGVNSNTKLHRLGALNGDKKKKTNYMLDIACFPVLYL